MPREARCWLRDPRSSTHSLRNWHAPTINARWRENWWKQTPPPRMQPLPGSMSKPWKRCQLEWRTSKCKWRRCNSEPMPCTPPELCFWCNGPHLTENANYMGNYNRPTFQNSNSYNIEARNSHPNFAWRAPQQQQWFLKNRPPSAYPNIQQGYHQTTRVPTMAQQNQPAPKVNITDLLATFITEPETPLKANRCKFKTSRLKWGKWPTPSTHDHKTLFLATPKSTRSTNATQSLF